MLAWWAQNLSSTQLLLIRSTTRLEERLDGHRLTPAHTAALLRIDRLEDLLAELRGDVKVIRHELVRPDKRPPSHELR